MNEQLLGTLHFFVTTFAELIVLFVLVGVFVAWLQQKLPRHKVQVLLSGKSGYFTAAGLGAITPFCSCSTLPMMVGLLRANAAFGPVMTFLFTSPLLNPYVLAMMWVILGGAVALLYAVVILLVSLLAGVMLQAFNFRRFVTLPQPDNSTSACMSSKPQGLKVLLQKSIKETKDFLPHILLGVAMGSIIHGYVPASLISQVSAKQSLWFVPAAALGGILLYIRASTMLPLAASLVAKGVSLGPVMALTIGGAGASLPEMIILKRLFRWPLMLAFITVVLGIACVTGFSIIWLLEA
ncbi:permease [Aliiglaciecola sp. CAU 1673]|uniref:permease n=1 Tax=Aliiglaciecola sp. CAU 1673 TaxID=3032595 RepID=UPI0023DAD2AC|nr:permease [Aliiglaciecola sp. CAU 1673]MDF2179945.1 permease [Aliiglaciecola sp. CAU 1673]